MELEKRSSSLFNHQETIDEASSLIYELYEDMTQSSITQRGVKKPIDVVIKNTLGTIHQMENNFISLYNEMVIIQGDEKNPDKLFKKLVEKIKMINKAKKHQEARKALIKLKEKKNLKYLQRMNRFKVRGPIVYPPPWVLERKKQNLDKNSKDEDNDEEMIYYN